MKRIIKLEEILLKENEVLAEVFYTKSLIIKPSSTDTKDFDHCVVIAVNESVKDMGRGDIILQVNAGTGFKIDERVFMLIPRYHIDVAVKASNFLDKSNLPN